MAKWEVSTHDGVVVATYGNRAAAFGDLKIRQQWTASSWGTVRKVNRNGS